MDIINDIIFIFHVVSLFSIMLTTFFVIIKTLENVKSFKNNNCLQKDFEKGIKFKSFLKELIVLEENSSLARVLLAGYTNFDECYKIQKYNYGSPIVLAKTAMREKLHNEIIVREKNMFIFALNTVVTLYTGMIFFLAEIVNNYNNQQLFFDVVINNIYILLITLFLSFYSSIAYISFKNLNDRFEQQSKGYIESFLKFMHKEIIIRDE